MTVIQRLAASIRAYSIATDDFTCVTLETGSATDSFTMAGYGYGYGDTHPTTATWAGAGSLVPAADPPPPVPPPRRAIALRGWE